MNSRIIAARSGIARLRNKMCERIPENPAAVAVLVKQEVDVLSNCETQRTAIRQRKPSIYRHQRILSLDQRAKIQGIDVKAIFAFFDDRDPELAW